MITTKKMLRHVQPQVAESSLITSPNEVTSATKNRSKPRNWHSDKSSRESVDWYKCSYSQDKNDATARFSSSIRSKSKKERRYCGGKGRWNSYNNSWIFFLSHFLLVSITSCRSAEHETCIVGLNTSGRTWPKGDISLEHGQHLRIYCMLDESLTDPTLRDRNASDLVFFRNDVLVEREYITVFNKTTIMMHVDEPSPSESVYFCKVRLSNGYSKQYAAVCLNKVFIGSKPKKPENFNCVSHNWQKLICTWKPLPNYVKTRFSLEFQLPVGQVTGWRSFPCPVSRNHYYLRPNTCVWDITTDPSYRMVYEYYTFRLNAQNALGKDNFTYTFHHYANVIPSKPINLSVINKTSSSAMLYWRVAFPMQTFPPGLHHRVAYQNQRDPREFWKIIEITNDVHATEKYFNLTDLKYANSEYKVKIFMKSSLADDEDKWSEFTEVAFKTDPTLPGLPPKTDIGSFEIAGNSGTRDVYIYWQTIPADLENGHNFTYQIVHVEENGRSLDIQPDEITKTYAKFTGISFSSFKFEIAAVNCIGANNQTATVRVPSQMEMPQKPVVFTKIAVDRDIYELSWDPPSNSAITNYTIFWCENDRDRPYQCSGYLDWVHVSRDTNMYNAVVPDSSKIYQFAIAANTAQGSGGLIWVSSMTILSNVVGKIESVWINHIESNLIEVRWKLEYTRRIGIVEAFNLYYCPILSPYNLTCQSPNMNTIVRGDQYTTHGVVRGLKSSTSYMLTVVVLSKKKEGLHSDPLYFTTLDPVSKNAGDLRYFSHTSDKHVSTAIKPNFYMVENFIDNNKQQDWNGANDNELSDIGIKEFDSDSTDCIKQVKNLTLIVSALKSELRSLSDEILLIRERGAKCNETW